MCRGSLRQRYDDTNILQKKLISLKALIPDALPLFSNPRNP